MTKSTNTEGNPWHDDEGKFTSPDAATLGVSVDDFLSYKKGGNFQLKSGIDLNALLSQGALNLNKNVDLNALLGGKKTLAESLKFSVFTEDIKENALKVLDNPEYINNLVLNFNFNGSDINEMKSHEYYTFMNYGYKTSAWNDCIIYELAYTLYPKKAKKISSMEYQQKLDIIKTQGSGQLDAAYSWKLGETYYDNIDIPNLRDLGCGMIAVFRGITGLYASSITKKELKDMYSEGSSGYPLIGRRSKNSGSIHYFSMSNKHFAMEGESSASIINGIVDLSGKNKDANIITINQLKELYNRVKTLDIDDPSFKNKVNDTIKNNLVKNGYDNVDDMSKKICDAFFDTLGSDQGLVGLLSGARIVTGSRQQEFDLYDLSLLEMEDN